MTRRKKKNYNDDYESLLRYLYAIIFIVISIIALLHDYTGFLGGLLCNCTRFLFGYIWFIPFVGLIIIGILLVMNKSISMNKYYISAILLFIAGLIACSIPKDLSLKGNEIFDSFILNSKAIYLGDYPAMGGLIGTLLYALFSRLIDFIGTMIILAVLVIVAIAVFLSDGTLQNFMNVLKSKSNSKKALKTSTKKAKQQEKTTTKKNDTFINLPEKKEKKFTFLKAKDKDEKADLKPIIKNSDISDEPYVDEYKPKTKAASQSTTKPVEKKETLAKQEPSKSTNIAEEPIKGVYNEKNYVKPKPILLDVVASPKKNSNSRNAVDKWNKLEAILDSFGLPSELQNYNIGPSVTQFELVPCGNFNIKKYASIEENIKMELAVRDLRIEAPIPGKRAIGIEIPNEIRVPVKLRELLTDIPDEYVDQTLLMALGKDLTGRRVYGRIDKMPHLLIAGSTGSGKSVCINSIILSILFQARPDQVKLILVDPKKVEFTPYANIPHLACPIINDTSKAADALKKLVMIMEQRYDAFSKVGCRNISEFNAKAPTKMCSFVCIIDELADLMATHGKDVETYIMRLAAMARAAGIYMILSTQRPSTDVITGTIKNNIASRIALSVGSSIDSRTIIDRTGAESLLGNGDMLYFPTGMTSPLRVQGVYVTDEEVRKVTKYFEDSNYLPRYEDIFIIDEDAEDGGTGAAICEDPLYSDIKKWVCSLSTISASGLQRRYGLGFPRAAKLIDALEQDGVISGANGSKPRDVLVKNIED